VTSGQAAENRGRVVMWTILCDVKCLHEQAELSIVMLCRVELVAGYGESLTAILGSYSQKRKKKYIKTKHA